MTQEEKAKAYDEALTIAKRIISKNCSEVEKLCLKSIFPELAESEDERIRKELKEAFEAYDIESTWNGIPIRSIFAWLEKRKEPQYAIRATKGFGDPAGPQFKLVDLQEEQKPAEWSDYKDKINVPYCSSEPKWSEEDEKQIRQIERIVKDAGGSVKLQEQIHNWFESLRPSWKPSAQELGALKTAVSVLTEERTFPKAAEQIQKIIDVFDGKELRKDWKPSEEQMNYLWSIYRGGEEQEPLRELIQDLKKL